MRWGYEKTVFLSGQSISTYRSPASSAIDHLAWSPDGKQIAIAGQQMKMQTLDAATRTSLPGPLMARTWPRKMRREPPSGEPAEISA